MKRALVVFLCSQLMFGPFAAADSKNPDKRPAEISLGDLGFQASATAPDTELQKSLNERRFMLMQHQLWGLVALGLMGAAILTGEEGNAPSEHIALAAASTTAFWISGYYGIAAPGLPPGMKASGPSLWHRRLAWLTGAGMIAAPILGYLAKKQVDRGEKIGDIEKYHKDVAYVTGGALAISVALVSFEF